MMPRKRLYSAVSLLLALVLTLSACGQETAEPETKEEETKKEEELVVDDVRLQDSQVIYQDDDEDSIVTMYLTVRKGNETDNTNHTWEEVNAHSVYYYQEQGIDRYRVAGILQVGDENGPVAGMFGYGEFAPNCTVQIRGQTSSRSPQKSYKIEINKNEGYWREQRTIALNKHVYDSVRFRNKLSYDLLKTIPGAFSARTQFVRLYVKDETTGNTNAQFEDYGLYTQVEQINKTYLRNHGLDENGQLYKAIMFEFLRYEDVLLETSDPSYDQTAFESILEIKGSDDHSKLIAMLEELNDYSIPIETTFEKYFDEENYFTWLAFQMLTGNRDTVSQNFYLYSPQNGTKWYFISWDNDAAWNYVEDITYGGVSAGYHYDLGASGYWGSVLHQRVLKSDELRGKLTRKLEELMEVVTKERVTELTALYSGITREYLSRMPDQMYAPEDMATFEEILKHIPEEMEYNYQFYHTSLEYPMPFYLAEPTALDGNLVFAWDSSYDFDGEALTYKFELSQDYTFASTINVQEGLSVPQAFYEMLPAGQYFYRVTCTNESGRTQTAMEMYEGANEIDYYGVRTFYVNPDGTIQQGG